MSNVQVKKEHYDFFKYVNKERWFSYYYQMICFKNLNIKKILLIGIGDGLVAHLLKETGYELITFDFDKSLNPDICGSVIDLEKILHDKEFDLIICCQVLEHLPFENFESIISQFNKYAKNVVLSLPYNRSKLLALKVWLPKLKEFEFKILIPKLNRKFRFDIEGNKEHYWEIGIKGKKYSKKNIRSILRKYFEIEKEFNFVENTYHVFYILKKEEKNEKN